MKCFIFEAALATVGKSYSTFGRLLVRLRWLLVQLRQVLVRLKHMLFRLIIVAHVFLLPPRDQE